MTKWTGQAPLICKQDRGLNTPIPANNIKGGGGDVLGFRGVWVKQLCALRVDQHC